MKYHFEKYIDKQLLPFQLAAVEILDGIPVELIVNKNGIDIVDEQEEYDHNIITETRLFNTLARVDVGASLHVLGTVIGGGYSRIDYGRPPQFRVTFIILNDTLLAWGKMLAFLDTYNIVPKGQYHAPYMRITRRDLPTLSVERPSFLNERGGRMLGFYIMPYVVDAPITRAILRIQLSDNSAIQTVEMTTFEEVRAEFLSTMDSLFANHIFDNMLDKAPSYKHAVDRIIADTKDVFIKRHKVVYDNLSQKDKRKLHNVRGYTKSKMAKNEHGRHLL